MLANNPTIFKQKRTALQLPKPTLYSAEDDEGTEMQRRKGEGD
jgi:hypothetical protein